MSAPRRDVHDDLLPVLALQQERQERPRDKERSLDIHLPRFPPLPYIRIRDLLKVLQIPRVVDQDIQPPERLANRLGSGIDRRLVRHIQIQAQDLQCLARPFSVLGDRVDCRFLHFLERARGPRADDDPGRAGARERDGCGPPDPAARARDEDDFARKVPLGGVDRAVGVVVRGVREELACI